MTQRNPRDRYAAARAEYADAASGLLTELRASGFDVEAVQDLYAGRTSYKKAIPVLISWLGRLDNDRVERDVVRALTDRSARPRAAAPLIRRFRQLGHDAPALGLKCDIGHALAVVADDSVFEDIANLVADQAHGRSREWLVVALGRMRDPRAHEVVLRALDDPDLTPFALRALGALGRAEDVPVVEQFLDHEKTLVRKEAKRAAAKLAR